jgi:hypothetical protein
VLASAAAGSVLEIGGYIHRSNRFLLFPSWEVFAFVFPVVMPQHAP